MEIVDSILLVGINLSLVIAFSTSCIIISLEKLIDKKQETSDIVLFTIFILMVSWGIGIIIFFIIKYLMNIFM